MVVSGRAGAARGRSERVLVWILIRVAGSGNTYITLISLGSNLGAVRWAHKGQHLAQATTEKMTTLFCRKDGRLYSRIVTVVLRIRSVGVVVVASLSKSPSSRKVKLEKLQNFLKSCGGVPRVDLEWPMKVGDGSVVLVCAGPGPASLYALYCLIASYIHFCSIHPFCR